MINNLAPYPAMKDSGVEWLGEVPAHWEVRKLKSLMSNVNEQTSQRQNGDIYVALEHIESWTGHIIKTDIDTSFDSQVKRFRSGDILFGKLRPYLAKVTRVNSRGVCVSELLVLRPREAQISVPYMEQLLRTKPIIDEINSSTFGAKMPRANWQFIGWMLVSFPPPIEQAAIVRYLDYVERRIQRYAGTKRKLLGLLAEQKQAIIHRAVTRGLNPDVPLKPSGIEWLGDVPAHWDVSRLKSHLTKNDSGVWGNFSDTGTTVLRSTEQTASGGWRIKLPAKIELSPMEMKAALLETGDLVVTKSSGSQAHIGKTSLVNPEIAAMECCFSNFIQRLRVDKKTDSTYVWYNLNSRVGREQLIFYSTTTTGLGNLNGTILGNCRFTFPPLPEQTAISGYLDKTTAKIDAVIARTHREIELINEYRTRLIADVVTGKVDVCEAAAKLPDEPDANDVMLDSGTDGALDSDTTFDEAAELDMVAEPDNEC